MYSVNGFSTAGQQKYKKRSYTAGVNHEITLAMNNPRRKNIWTGPGSAGNFNHGTRPFAGVLMALLAALACGPIGADTVRTDTALSFGTGSYWHHAHGINNAVDQFLGRPAGSGGANGIGGGGLDGDISANSPVDLRFHSAVALNWRHTTPLRPTLALVAGARLEYGRARYFVKDGVGPLLDDITARLDHVGITASLALRHSLRPGRMGQLHIGAGLGAEVLWSRTHVTSALLDVRRSDRFHDSLAFASLEWAPEQAPGSTVALQLEWRDSIGPALRLGVQQQF
jgi:hypothetical protein